MIDLLGRIPCVQNESVVLIHGKPCLYLRPKILAYPSWIVLLTMYGSFVPQEVISYDLTL